MATTTLPVAVNAPLNALADWVMRATPAAPNDVTAVPSDRNRSSESWLAAMPRATMESSGSTRICCTQLPPASSDRVGKVTSRIAERGLRPLLDQAGTGGSHRQGHRVPRYRIHLADSVTKALVEPEHRSRSVLTDGRAPQAQQSDDRTVMAQVRASQHSRGWLRRLLGGCR